MTTATPIDIGTAEARSRSVQRLVRELRSYISMMTPRQKERQAVKLLIEAVKLLSEATDEIKRLHAAIVMTLDENKHLADGNTCTLIRLKRAVSPHDQAEARLPDSAAAEQRKQSNRERLPPVAPVTYAANDPTTNDSTTN